MLHGGGGSGEPGGAAAREITAELVGQEWRMRKALHAGEVLAAQELREERNREWRSVRAKVALRALEEEASAFREKNIKHSVPEVAAVPLERWLDRERVGQHIVGFTEREQMRQRQLMEKSNTAIYNRIEEMAKRDRERELMVLQRETERQLVQKHRLKLAGLERAMQQQPAQPGDRGASGRLSDGSPQSLLSADPDDRLAAILQRRQRLPSAHRAQRVV